MELSSGCEARRAALRVFKRSLAASARTDPGVVAAVPMRTRAAAFGLARQQCRNLPRQRFASSAQTTPQAAKLAAPYDIKLKKLQRDSCERTLRMGHGWARCKSIDSRSGFLAFRHTRFGVECCRTGFTQVEMPVTSSATQIESRDTQGRARCRAVSNIPGTSSPAADGSIQPARRLPRRLIFNVTPGAPVSR